MTLLGPVSNATHGGPGSPLFSLIAGFGVMLLTWVRFSRGEKRSKAEILISIAITLICGVFIYTGLRAMFFLR
jgi:hypothetical protein